MKLRLRFQNNSQPIVVNDDINVADFRAIVSAQFEIFNFGLSLNRNDFFDQEDNFLCTLASLTIRDGDIVYVVPNSQNSADVVTSSEKEKNVAVEEKSKKCKTDTTVVDMATGSSGTSVSLMGGATAEPWNLRTIKDKLISNVKENDVKDDAQSLICLIHILLIEHGFAEKNSRTIMKFPDNWKSTSDNGFYRLTYIHPKADVTLNVTFVRQSNTDLTLTGWCKVGDKPISVEKSFRLTDIMRPYNPDRILDHFVNFENLVDQLRNDFVDKVKIAVVGYGSALQQIPNDILEKIVRPLQIRSFSRLTRSCQKMRPLWTNENLWKYFLKRDFGGGAVEAVSNRTFKSEYETRYLRRKEMEELEMSRFIPIELERGHGPLNPYPPVGNPWDPPPFAGSRHIGPIGGDYDVNPLAAPGPLYIPRPMIRPRLPYDPDAGLPRPPAPGRHRPPFPPGPRFPGPFGGGFI